MSPDIPGPETGTKNRRAVDAIVLSLCVVVAFVLRVWTLHGRNLVDFDETYYYMLGRNLLTGHAYTLNGLPHTAFPPLYPLLVGLVSFFTDSVALATSGVSAVAGALLPIPVYFLAREVHGRTSALLAAASIAVWRSLFFYAAINTQYADRLYFGSEPLYLTLVALGALFIYRFAVHGGRRHAAFAGVLFGLASLTRSEGPVLFAFLFAWLVMVLAVSGKLRHRERLLQTGLVAAAMILTLSPFLIYVRAVTGAWSLGAKLDNNTRIRDTLWTWVTMHDNRAFMETHYALNDDNSQMEDPYWGVSAWYRSKASQSRLLSGARVALTPDWRWLKVFTDIFWNVRRPLVPRYAWALLIIGLLMPPWTRGRLLWWTFALSAFAAMAFLAVSLYALPRHELPLLVFFAAGVGKGLQGLTDLFHRAAVDLFEAKGIVAAGLSLVPAVVFFVVMIDSGARLNSVGNRRPGIDPALSRQASEARLAGFLKSKLPPGSTLMCNSPWLALWAGMEWRVSPYTSPSRLVLYARAKGIDYAVLYSWQMKYATGEPDVLKPYIIGETEFGDRQYILRFGERPGLSSEPESISAP